MKFNISYIMILLGLVLMMSCKKEPIDIGVVEAESFQTEVFLCDFEISFEEEIGDTSVIVTAIVTGGVEPYDFYWSNGGSDDQDIIEISEGGTYFISIEDDEGCIDSDSIVIDFGMVDCENFIVDIIQNTTEFELLAELMGGTPPYTYSWSNGDTNPNIEIGSDSIFTVYITDAEGCFASDSIFIENNIDCLSFNGNLVYDEITFVLGANFSGGTAPYNFDWSTGETTETILAQNDGTYSVIITDSNGCAFYAEYNVDISGCNNLSVLISQDTLYNELTASVSGGTPSFVFEWTTGATTSVISFTENGVYGVSVTDSEGCVSFYSEFFNFLEACDLLYVEFDYDQMAGTLSATPVNGTAPYSYSWDTGETIQTINVTAGNSYTVTIVDGEGCTEIAQRIL